MEKYEFHHSGLLVVLALIIGSRRVGLGLGPL